MGFLWDYIFTTCLNFHLQLDSQKKFVNSYYR